MLLDVSVYELAAFAIDFEGSISLAGGTTRCRTPRFEPMISITNTSKMLLRSFYRDVGFGVVLPDPRLPSQENRALSYIWKMTAFDIRQHLRSILPYLVLKLKQAQLMIEACGIIQIKALRSKSGQIISRSDEANFRLQGIYEEIHELNKTPHYKANRT